MNWVFELEERSRHSQNAQKLHGPVLHLLKLLETSAVRLILFKAWICGFE